MTDQELQAKLDKESGDFRVRGDEARLCMLFDRLAEMLVKLHEIEKRLEPKPPSHLI